MADAGTAGQPIVDAGTQVGTPVATMGFGAREDADTTRQAQHELANDVPVDVNINAVVARSQTLTFDVLGKDFATAHKRLDMIQERFIAGVKAPA